LQKKFASIQPNKITLHAELDALTKLRTVDPEIDCMVVVRTLRSSEAYGSSKPCDICVGAMLKYEVGSVVYFEKGFWHRVYL
jgi:tRNA(Arg) A34 adenosine deaminase TadA